MKKPKNRMLKLGEGKLFIESALYLQSIFDPNYNWEVNSKNCRELVGRKVIFYAKLADKPE